ncbi:U4/U6.U5 tri-snRNP-associated protein 2 [Sitodiplosis mosellana]|uniref:U4/U6.U5 tri-snRNP-associated protein 2 n=1 Tax=Sitodiplosis mosellana TaxID=263140 RepID=UPI002443838E|nr:U4/U6.U5 tri-snRNP-associated protein 2 [Sitodiplosis mosellana]
MKSNGTVAESPAKKLKAANVVDDDDEDNEPKLGQRPSRKENPKSRQCPYLDTINRNVLDFDFEKLCSVSLTRINVYACLVCGKYFQGRGTNTHAYTHSVADSHHVFLNLHNLKFYCLPDNYEIIDSSLNDIKYLLNPTFNSENIRQLDSPDVKPSRTIDGTLYNPGIVGQRFGELMRKMWNPRNFKAHVSPHEMLQAVVLWSNKQFQITQQGDPIDFLSWFLHTTHRALRGNKKPDSFIINKAFLGQMNVYTRKIPSTDLDDTQKSLLLATEEYQEKVEATSFLYLTCDLPAPPLFIDEFRENIIPQVSLYQLLAKFNGISEKEYKTYKDSFMKRFEITQLPPFIILYIKRFTKNTFFLEKNPTIVNFPVRNVDFGDILTEENRAKHKHTRYNLIANVVHDGEPNKGTYRVHILQKSTGQWYEMQDLHVTNILPQMITLTEAYIQIYELQTDAEQMEH